MGDAAAPVFSVLVVGFRSLRFLEGCLGSLLKSQGPSFELLFLDNASPEPEADWVEGNLRDTRLKVFRSDRNRFFAGGMNFLAGRAAGEYLLLLNPDTRTEPDCLAKLETVLRSGFDGVQADLRALENPEQRESRGHFLDRLGFIVHAGPAAGTAAAPIFAGRGAGLAVRRSIYLEAGGLDEALKMYFEETDFCWRVNLMGYRIGYVPGAIIRHLKGGSSRPAFFEWNQFRFVRNRITCMLANYQGTTLLYVLPAHLAIAGAGALANLLRLKPGRALTEAAALVSPWFLLGHALAKRRRVQALRKVSDGELLRRGLILRGLKLLGARA